MTEKSTPEYTLPKEKSNMGIQSTLKGGVTPPIATPLHDNGELDVESLLALREHLRAGGVSGVFALGSIGEAVYLTDAIRRQVVATLRSAGDDLPLLVGLVEPTASRVIDAATRMADLGADAFVVTAPFYANNSESEIYDHYVAIAEATDVPVLAYNIPPNVRRPLPRQVSSRLIADGVIIGIKDSSDDVEEMRSLVSAPHPDAALYLTGSDFVFADTLAAGANGSVAGLANVAPELFVRGISAHVSGDASTLAATQKQIDVLVGLYKPDAADSGANSTQLGSIKSALALLGVISSDAVTRPMRRSSPARLEYIRSVLADVGLEVGA